MPGKYTGDLVDGKVVTFSDFALRCARSMNVLHPAHGDPWNSPIPDEFAVDISYYDNMEKEAEATLAWLEATSEEEITEAASCLYRGELLTYSARVRRAELSVQRCRSMLAMVKAWVPPTESHMDFKQFMIDRLEETIGWNGDVRHLQRPRPLAATEYANRERQSAESDLAHAREQRESEIARVEKHNLWVRQLRESLPEESSA